MKPFNKLVRSIKPLMNDDPELCMKLRKYVYDMVGCCHEVHQDMGPFVNEYMYQDALEITLLEHGFKKEDIHREYYFSTEYHGQKISHPHKVDFFLKNKVYIECKAVETLVSEHRQQLWNYMRLSGIRIGILYNFAPIKDQCEKYYLDIDKQVMYTF